MDHIDGHLDESLELKDVAEVAGFSRIIFTGSLPSW